MQVSRKENLSGFSFHSQLYLRAIVQFQDDEDPDAAYETMIKAVKLANWENDDPACINSYALFSRICASLQKYDEMEKYYLHITSFSHRLDSIREGHIRDITSSHVIAILNAYN